MNQDSENNAEGDASREDAAGASPGLRPRTGGGKRVTGKPEGEVFVWATAAGLSLGLAMILFLLGLIFVNGVEVFWPKPVALFELEEGAEFRGSREVAGIVVSEQEKDLRDLTPEQLESEDPRDRREKQLFTGNRDTYGSAFVFFNVGDIASVSYPKELVHAERTEWGDAIFYPLTLRMSDGSEVSAGGKHFRDALNERVRELSDLRSRVDRIERRQIGRINLRMRELELDIRYYEALPDLTAEQVRKLESLHRERADLQGRYEPLAAEAQDLRRQLREDHLQVRMATGEERSMAVGDIVSYTFPNQLSLLQKSGLFFKHLWDFLSGFPREANTEGGIFPAIFGTFFMTLIMSVAVTPFGVIAAIYLREYARQGFFVRSVRIAINNLAGVPSIVFGIFGLGFFVYFVGGTIDQVFFPKALAANTPTFGTGGILWASLTLALMTVPVVIVATEEALAAVSRGVREGSLACGASKWQTIQNLVIPASAPGILTGLVLAMARGAGEVAPLMLIGVVALAPNLPVDGIFPFIHLDRKFMHLGFHIYDLGFQSPDSEAAKPMVFATTLVLIALVVTLNIAAIWLRQHLKKRYAASAF